MLSERTSEFIKIKIMNMIHLCYNVIVEDHKNFINSFLKNDILEFWSEVIIVISNNLLLYDKRCLQQAKKAADFE